MAVHLVRHAHAGSRGDWPGEDSARPLDKKGWKQATRLAHYLAPLQPRLVSSPFVRCTQTLEPTATALGTGVEEDPALGEDADPGAVLALLERFVADGRESALSTHGNVVHVVLDHLVDRGVLERGAVVCPKGSVWSIEVDAAGQMCSAALIRGTTR